jgi:hypothetical protein
MLSRRLATKLLLKTSKGPRLNEVPHYIPRTCTRNSLSFKNSQFVQTSVFPRCFSLASSPFDQQYADEVRVKDQLVKCIIGCNPDERDRIQDLVISVRLWTNLRESMSKYINNCDVLESQKSRASSSEWAAHAAAELAGTYNYSTGKINTSTLFSIQFILMLPKTQLPKSRNECRKRAVSSLLRPSRRYHKLFRS